VWLREKEVQKVKADKNISFPHARQIVTQQQSTLLRSGPTSAAVVSAAVSAQRHPTVTVAAPIKSSSVAVQTDLTWPSGQELPVQIPHKSIASQTVSRNRLMGGASTASALQMTAAMASSSAATNDSSSFSQCFFQKTHKTQSNKADKSGKPKLRRPPRSDSELPTNNRYSPLGTEVDDALSDSDSQILIDFFMPTILQWNIRGLQANREELDLLFSNSDPTVICLQETFLKENKNINFKHYSSYHRHASEANGIVHGGSSVLVKPSTPHRQIKLLTGL